MPELPEVETSRRGVLPHIKGSTLAQLIVRQPKLRWPIESHLPETLAGNRLNNIRRRGKYMLFDFEAGTVLIHLGMSGSVRILTQDVEVTKHDHFDMLFSNGNCLRFNDPRRFGSLLWAGQNPLEHSLISKLGPEPLDEDFGGEYCYQKSRGKRIAIKQFIMDSHLVVGVGNIYANESLFKAGIHPSRQAGKVSLKRYLVLAQIIKEVLSEAIEQGGTSLKDFTNADGKPGYFKQQLAVYGRGGEPCVQCNTSLKEVRHNNRATVYCSKCQK